MNDTFMQILRLAAKGYACSQILILMALDARGESNPSLVRAVAGLAYGAGGGRATCGVLTGACCVIGYFAGKGGDGEEANPHFPLMLEELNDWFAQEVGVPYHGITCQDIVGEAGPQASRSVCGQILAKTHAKTLEILSSHGIE